MASKTKKTHYILTKSKNMIEIMDSIKKEAVDCIEKGDDYYLAEYMKLLKKCEKRLKEIEAEADALYN